MQRLEPSSAVRAHRQAWPNRGQQRPPFAEQPAAGQRSVWDFPRPPALAPLSAVVTVQLDEQTLARSERAVEVMETASAPTVYVPPEDVREPWLQTVDEQSHCEWKGLALAVYASDQAPRAPRVAIGWRYMAVYAEFESIYGWYAFYPQHVACFVGSERARAQPGGFYGGWVCDDLAGPIKGGPGSAGW